MHTMKTSNKVRNGSQDLYQKMRKIREMRVFCWSRRLIIEELSNKKRHQNSRIPASSLQKRRSQVRKLMSTKRSLFEEDQKTITMSILFQKAQKMNR